MPNIAIVGATGAVGGELIQVLEARGFPVASVRLLASPRSEGVAVSCFGGSHRVSAVGPESFEGVDIAFFSAGATRSREYVPHARRSGALVVDNSSAFRMDPDVPLVVPEVNPADLSRHTGLVANPNCVAAILSVAVAPLHALSPIRRLVVSTYQSASGAGARAMEDLLDQTRAALGGEPVVPRVLKHPYAFNLFSHDSDMEANGYNGEENKVVAELQKILNLPDLGISMTCVRVPVLRAHSASVNLTFDAPVDVAAAQDALDRADGVVRVEDAAHNHYPMPLEASGADDVMVGRIRKDPSCPRSLNMWIAGDQLLKGAALNAVQIAEALL